MGLGHGHIFWEPPISSLHRVWRNLLEEVDQSKDQCLSRGRSRAFRKVKEGQLDQRSRGELDRVLAGETNRIPQASLGSLNLITEP